MRRSRRRRRRSRRLTNDASPALPILVVDDDEDTRHALSEILTSAGFEPECAADGCAALGRLLNGFQPELILLDLEMPCGGGVAFRRRQRAEASCSGIPVVLLSGERDLAVWAGKLDVAEHIAKPIDVDQLLTTIRRVLAASKG